MHNLYMAIFEIVPLAPIRFVVQHGSIFHIACILALPDLSLAAPTVPAPPTAPENVHGKYQET